MEEDLKTLPGIGVFGTGLSTSILVPHLRQVGFQMVAVWGKTLGEAEECAKELSIPFATNRIDDVLLHKAVDLILVLSPPALHSQIAVKALGIGKHVVVQSPAGISQNETLRKVQAAQYYPSLISVVAYGLRFLPAFKILKKAISDDLLGCIPHVDVRITSPALIGNDEAYSWACDSHMGGGLLNQFGSNIIDLLSFVMDFKAARCHGTVRTFTKTTPRISGTRQISSDDFAIFQLESDQCLATISMSSIDQKFGQELVFYGSKGELRMRGQDLHFTPKSRPEELQVLYACPGESEASYPRLPDIYKQGMIAMFEELSQKLVLLEKNKNKENVEATEDVPNVDSNTFASFEDGLYVQAVMEAVRVSSKDKTWTKVNVVDSSAAVEHPITNNVFFGSGTFCLAR